MTPIEYTMGSDTFGTRVSNALRREGFLTIEALRELRETIGEIKFESRMEEIRGIGRDAMTRIHHALTLHPSKYASAPKVALADALPEGFRERLVDTLGHLIDQGARSSQKLLPEVVEGDPFGPLTGGPRGSLTAGDLETLANLFLGYNYNLDLRAET